ncbi:MAG: hypothetical protein ACLPHP_06815 [Candidatus Sulfotelmatobacter sp.]
MRIVYIAGFFKHVLPELQKRMGKLLESGAVVWIPQYRNTDELNVNRFKGAFFDAVSRGATEILICVFIMRDNTTLPIIVDTMIDEAKSRSKAIEIRVERFKNARDADGVIEQVEAFNPEVEGGDHTVPDSLSDLEQWLAGRHPERVMIHPRAVGAAKKSRYGDIALIYSALDLLGTEYWNMRTSPRELAHKRRYVCDERLKELGLELSLSISDSRAGEQGDEYKVIYPLGSERKRLLEFHLRKGSDRDERFCLRIYFFWDEAAKKVVVGWLPSHLDTRST